MKSDKSEMSYVEEYGSDAVAGAQVGERFDFLFLKSERDQNTNYKDQ